MPVPGPGEGCDKVAGRLFAVAGGSLALLVVAAVVLVRRGLRR